MGKQSKFWDYEITLEEMGRNEMPIIIPGDKRKLKRIKHRLKERGFHLLTIERSYWPKWRKRRR